jgi:hypothetical protein
VNDPADVTASRQRLGKSPLTDGAF